MANQLIERALRGEKPIPRRPDEGGFLGSVGGLIAKATGITALTGVRELDLVRNVFPTALRQDVHVAAAAYGAQQLGVPLARIDAGLRVLNEGVADMDFKDVLRVVASGISSGEDGLTYDYGAAASTLSDALAPTRVMAMAPAIGGGGALPSLGSLAARLGLTGGAVARAVGAIVGAVRSVGGRIVGFFTASGRRVSVKEAVLLAGNIGLSAAAAALAVDERELAEAVMQELKKKRGRARGITASQLRTTRRTMRKIESMHRQIHRAAKSAVSHRR